MVLLGQADLLGDRAGGFLVRRQSRQRVAVGWAHRQREIAWHGGVFVGRACYFFAQLLPAWCFAAQQNQHDHYAAWRGLIRAAMWGLSTDLSSAVFGVMRSPPTAKGGEYTGIVLRFCVFVFQPSGRRTSSSACFG